MVRLDMWMEVKVERYDRSKGRVKGQVVTNCG